MRDLRRIEVDNAVHAEAGVQRTGLGIEREQLAVRGWYHDLRLRLRIAGEIFHPTRYRVAAGQLVNPDFLAAGRIQRHHAPIRRGDVHDAAHHQRCHFGFGETGIGARGGGDAFCRRLALWGTGGSAASAATAAATTGRDKVRRPHVIDPGDAQVAHGAAVDLRQRRKAHAAGIMTVGWPFGARATGLRKSKQPAGGTERGAR